ncbi:MAG: ABC transporter permease, partial [Candidatus Korarchaeum sp.]|nr:ABC transporter permease [Candidatus Korarchaeum sp.]MDW8034988.1 ABC transporter permease [Candidatus Korarchaeum sp.]
LLGVSILVFIISLTFAPEQRAALYITSPKGAARIYEIIEKYGLNKPPHEQYFTWLSNVLQGNLGYSKSLNIPVARAFTELWPVSVEITIYAAPILILVGMKLGKISAVYRDKLPDHLARIFAIIGWSLPIFWSAIVLLAVFYGGLGIFPPGRLSLEAQAIVRSPEWTTYTGLYTIDALLNRNLFVFLDALEHLFLPVINLVIVGNAVIMRVMRSSMLEELSKDYVIAARSKGVDEGTIINKHVTRNALIPVATIAGIVTAGFMTGLVITETVFELKGLGYWAAHAAQQLDIPSVLAFALFTGVVFVISNLVVDVLYAYIDPRVRLE